MILNALFVVAVFITSIAYSCLVASAKADEHAEVCYRKMLENRTVPSDDF